MHHESRYSRSRIRNARHTARHAVQFLDGRNAPPCVVIRPLQDKRVHLYLSLDYLRRQEAQMRMWKKTGTVGLWIVQILAAAAFVRAAVVVARQGGRVTTKDLLN
jgi:hypothetical protein